MTTTTAARPISPSQVSLTRVWDGYHVWNIYTSRETAEILRVSVNRDPETKEWVVATKADLNAESVEVARVGSLAQVRTVAAWLYNDRTGAEQASLAEVLASAAPARRKAAASLSPVEEGVKVGDFYCASWGYDQTNIDFYEVVALGAKSVKVREVAQHRVEAEGPHDSVVPAAGHYIGEVETKVLRPCGRKGGALSFSSYKSAWLWDGTPQYRTASGWGH